MGGAVGIGPGAGRRPRRPATAGARAWHRHARGSKIKLQADRMHVIATRYLGLTAACVGLVLGGCAAAPPSPPSTTDAFGTVNAARSRGCGAASGQVAPLRADPRLNAVAARLPGGEKLADAVSAERYPAARSASIHVMRAASSDELYELLTKRFCSDVADPEFQPIGL